MSQSVIWHSKWYQQCSHEVTWPIFRRFWWPIVFPAFLWKVEIQWFFDFWAFLRSLTFLLHVIEFSVVFKVDPKVIWHYKWYLKCSPRLKGHLYIIFFWPILFPATLWKFVILLFFSFFFFFSKLAKMADFWDSAGRLADVANLKISASSVSLQNNLQSRSTPTRSWDIFIFILRIEGQMWELPEIYGFNL